MDRRRQVRGSRKEIVRELSTKYKVQCTKYEVRNTKYESETNVEFRTLIEECRSRDKTVRSTKYHVQRMRYEVRDAKYDRNRLRFAP